MAAETVVEKPYCRIREETLQRAMALIDQCGQVICAADVDADGEWNQPLRQLAGLRPGAGQAGGGLPLIAFDRL